MSVEWIEVKDRAGLPIGSVMYLDGKLAGLAAYHDDRDKDKSGDVSIGERIQSYLPIVKMKGSVLTDVAAAAYSDPNLLMKDPSLRQLYGQVLVHFAHGLVMEGIYVVYFSRGVRMMSSGVAKTVVSGTIKQFVVRKGMESAVKKAFTEATSL